MPIPSTIARCSMINVLALAAACTLGGCSETGTSERLEGGSQGNAPTDTAAARDGGAAPNAGGKDADGNRDAGDATDGSVAAAPLAGAALLAVTESHTALRSFITANAGFAPVFQLTVQVAPGDILRVRSQIEVTNDQGLPVGATSMLTATGGLIQSSIASKNVVQAENHHLPLCADGVLTVSAGGSVLLSAVIAASRSDTSPTLSVEDGGYGGLTVEHYRPFATLGAAQAASALGLAEVVQSNVALASSFGVGAPFVDVVAYRAPALGVAAAKGDIVRVAAQATGQWLQSPLDMESLAIFSGTTALSPYATTNIAWSTQSTPIFAETTDRPSIGARPVYEARMHGVNGAGNGIFAGGGHIIAQHFTPLLESNRASLRTLHQVNAVAGPAMVDAVVANAGTKEVARTSISLHGGDLVRVAGSVQLGYPSGMFSLGISCAAWAELRNAADALVATTPVSTEYATPVGETLPLRVELSANAAADGAHVVKLLTSCAREGGSPALSLGAASGSLFVDTFGATTP